MGIFDSDAVAGTQFFTDIDVTFTMSGETDSGLTFGASVDLDEGGDASIAGGVAVNNEATNNNADDGGATIFISGSFGTVTMGDIGVAVSIDDDNGAGEVGYAVGLRYNLDLGGTTVALGIGHQEAASLVAGPTANATGVSATANFAGGFSAGIVYADWDDDNPAAVGPDNNIGLGLGYTTGAFSIHANYGEVDWRERAPGSALFFSAAL